MPIVPYVNQVEPREDEVIWRFMKLYQFRDLMASEEIYFRRADLFSSDEAEGLPPERYVMQVLGLDPHNIKDRVNLNDRLGFLAQNRESYFISCWHLHREETLNMWEQYGHDGVAICSSYGRLKSALAGLHDDVHMGLVQYGTDHLNNSFNVLEFITTKQIQYSLDREVRALLVAIDPLAGGNRHFDLNNFPHSRPLNLNPRHSWVPECKRRRVNLHSLITEVFISPWAEEHAIEEIKLWVKTKGFPDSVRLSAFRSSLIPPPRVHKPEIARNRLVTKEELDRLFEELSGLPLDQVRHLYRQRWEACKLNPEGLPAATDIQYLEATLRVLNALKALEN